MTSSCDLCCAMYLDTKGLGNSLRLTSTEISGFSQRHRGNAAWLGATVE